MPSRPGRARDGELPSRGAGAAPPRRRTPPPAPRIKRLRALAVAPTIVPVDWIGYIALGLVAGIAAGSFGIGGGALIVPALALWFRVPYTVAVGTSLALIIPISLAGALTHQKFGNVDWRIFLACAIAGVIGAVAGSLLIDRVPEIYARRGFAVFLLYAAWQLWVK